MSSYIPNSNKLCPNCSQDPPLLRWSSANPPEVSFSQETGRIYAVTITRYCIGCGYTEQGFVRVDQDPTFTPYQEEEENSPHAI